MKNSMILGLVFLVAGVSLIVWGYNISQTLSSQFSQAFSGTPSNKALWMYGIGAALTLLGIWQMRRK